MVVLDTCAIIEACRESPSFSAKVWQQMNTGFYVLSVSFAEIACKIKTGTLEMDTSFRDLYTAYNQIEHIEIVNIDTEMWFDSIELNWKDNKDPADRLITAFAAKRKLAIVTTDKKIKKFYKKVIWG